jgi:hypothetical protein
MKKKLLYLSFLIIFLGCTKDKESKDVSAIRITKIQLQSYPVTNGAVPWDDPFLGSATGPDITWRISGPESFDSGFFAQDANGSAIVYTNGLPITLNSPKSQYTIQFWDIDDIDASDLASDDDLIISASFTPWVNEGDEERDAIVLNTGNTEIIIDVDYLFE